MLFKLALWASLTFFKDDPQIKIAVAQLICLIQVAVHTRLRPFNSSFKNTMQAFGIFLALAVAFGGLVINYLQASQKEALLFSNAEEAEALEGKLEAFKVLLEILVYVTFVFYAVQVIYRTVEMGRKHKRKIRKKCRKFCPCLKITEAEDEDSGAAAVEPSGAELTPVEEKLRDDDNDDDQHARPWSTLNPSGVVIVGNPAHSFMAQKSSSSSDSLPGVIVRNPAHSLSRGRINSTNSNQSATLSAAGASNDEAKGTSNHGNDSKNATSAAAIAPESSAVADRKSPQEQLAMSRQGLKRLTSIAL